MSDLSVCYIALCRGLRDETVTRLQQEIEQQREIVRRLQRQCHDERVWSVRTYPCEGDRVIRLRPNHFTVHQGQRQVYRLSYCDMKTLGSTETVFAWTVLGQDGLRQLRTKSGDLIYQTLMEHFRHHVEQNSSMREGVAL